MLRKLTRQQQTDSGLNLSRSDGDALVVLYKTRRFGRDALEDVVDKGIHYGHGLEGDTGVGMHLLQHLVDVDGKGLLALAVLLLLVGGADSFLGLARLLDGLTGAWGSHGERTEEWVVSRTG